MPHLSHHPLMAAKPTNRFWRISPGEHGYLWREQKLHGCIAVGWSEPGAQKAKANPALRRTLNRMHWPGARDSDQLANFIWDVRKGDKVVASTSGRGIYALGTITGEYRYNGAWSIGTATK